MVAIAKPGVNFTTPWQFMPFTATATGVSIIDSAGSGQTAVTVAFFTELSRRGVTDTTNWTGGAYKTILSVTSGKGLVAAIIGPTSAGADTTTFRITVDGVASTVAVTPLASGKRALLIGGYPTVTAYGITAGSGNWYASTEALKADKATFDDAQQSGSCYFPTWSSVSRQTIPSLIFYNSLLIEAQHSQSITNSTATAYSGVMYRLGL